MPCVQAEISTKHLLSASLECYFWTSLFDVYAMKSTLVISSAKLELVSSVSETLCCLQQELM
jgi:hypothetical protein